jgi:hypothetical protein
MPIGRDEMTAREALAMFDGTMGEQAAMYTAAEFLGMEYDEFCVALVEETESHEQKKKDHPTA